MELLLAGIGKKVGAQAWLYEMSLAPHPGAVTVLLGATQAGKTSLMRIMAGLDKPSTGTVRVDGRDVTGPGSGPGHGVGPHGKPPRAKPPKDGAAKGDAGKAKPKAKPVKAEPAKARVFDCRFGGFGPATPAENNDLLAGRVEPCSAQRDAHSVNIRVVANPSVGSARNRIDGTDLQRLRFKTLQKWNDS